MSKRSQTAPPLTAALRDFVGWVAPSPAEDERFACPMCDRANLDADGFWLHVKARHRPGELLRITEAAVPGASFEEALIKIANSFTHEEAVQLATSALLGSALREDV